MTPPTDPDQLLTLELLLGTISATTVLKSVEAIFEGLGTITQVAADDWMLQDATGGWALSVVYHPATGEWPDTVSMIYDDSRDNHHADTLGDHATVWSFLETVKRTVIGYKYRYEILEP